MSTGAGFGEVFNKSGDCKPLLPRQTFGFSAEWRGCLVLVDKEFKGQDRVDALTIILGIVV